MRIFESKEKIGNLLGGWFCFFLFFGKEKVASVSGNRTNLWRASMKSKFRGEV